MIRRIFAPLQRIARISALLAGLCASAWPGGLYAQDDVVFDPPARLVLNVGQFNFMNTGGDPVPANNRTAIMLRGAYQFDRWLYRQSANGWHWGIGPQVGAMVTGNGGGMVFAGLFGDFLYECGFYFSPEFNAGLYRRGGGRDLGGPVQFEEALTFGYELESARRLGVRFSHISNGDFYDTNPGVETIMLTYSQQLGSKPVDAAE